MLVLQLGSLDDVHLRFVWSVSVTDMLAPNSTASDFGLIVLIDVNRGATAVNGAAGSESVRDTRLVGHRR